MSDPNRAVFDCNILLQALSSPQGPSGRCTQLTFDGDLGLYVSPTVLDELRDVTARPRVIEKLRLIPERVAEFMDAVQRTATLLNDFSAPFTYDRDPDDAHYVNLALAAEAKWIVSHDKDLLDLMNKTRPEGLDFQARFGGIDIVTPSKLLQECRAEVITL